MTVGTKLKFGERAGNRWMELPGDPSWADRQGVASQQAHDAGPLALRSRSAQDE